MQKHFIFDCDPGADDAVLILMALACPHVFDILGITTVSGNAPIECINQNALKIVELSKRLDVKVFGGCKRPILRKPFFSTAHGDSGLDGSSLPTPLISLQPLHAVDFIIETLVNSYKKITLCISGPMTNIALALIKAPEIKEHIEEIIFMGGSTNGGNITPAAEFNFYADPHAAYIVLSSGLPMKMIGLNVTHQLVTSEARLKILSNIGNEVGRQVSDILAFDVQHDIDRYGLTGRAVHDACIAASILRPELFTFKKMNVSVDLTCEPTIGACIFDENAVIEENDGIWVAESIQSDHVFDLIIELMKSY